MSQKLYRYHTGTIAMGKLYTDHLQAMTDEDLSSKAEIAAELAWRDKTIGDLSDLLTKQDKGWKESNEYITKITHQYHGLVTGLINQGARLANEKFWATLLALLLFFANIVTLLLWFGK